ncbi:hypothetical protein MLC59_13030 [Marinobacter bryozoorum]|uniref:hypothetical protein n=1 Tax=Marinobacter bryozoorum TaxID=256324 RepID=UPI002006CAF7|nr:hypothetical protein [Marinobacter bryozoorum]MCK7545085.1 hypothetical protein [Marinobacter bryozoorum]
MENVKQPGTKLFLSYLLLVLSILIWAGAWSFPVVAEQWVGLSNCASGVCGAIVETYSSLLFKVVVVGVLILLTAKELLVSDSGKKLKLNLGIFLLGVVVTFIFIVGLSLPILGAEPV